VLLKAIMFEREGLNRRIVMCEFYHHLVEYNSLDFPIKLEKEEVNNFVRVFLRK